MSTNSRTLAWAVAATGGQLLVGSSETVFGRVVTDSRQAGPGDLFVALAGERFDGHDFLPAVVAQGVAGVLIAADHAARAVGGVGVVSVPSPRVAYGRLAGAFRREFAPLVTAIGGSNGKTTTKELLATLLSVAGPTLRNEASFNNDVGVPHTLLRLNATHRMAVLEAGTNHPGELAPLLALIQPQYGILTSIGREHLEFFGDLAGVAQEEGALAECLPAHGLLVLPVATPFGEAIAARSRAPVVRVGWDGAGDWSATLVSTDWDGSDFEVRSPRPDWSGTWRVGVPGRHNVLNALAALVIAAECGVDPTAARTALSAFQPPKQRHNVLLLGGVRVLDDTYNANADSMEAALRTLSDLPCAGRRVAVLGEMAELGSLAGTAHGEVGRSAARTVDVLFAVGPLALLTATAAREAGLAEVIHCADAPTAATAVARFVRSGDTVLVKASRSARLEQVTQALREPLLANPPA